MRRLAHVKIKRLKLIPVIECPRNGAPIYNDDSFSDFSGVIEEAGAKCPFENTSQISTLTI